MIAVKLLRTTIALLLGVTMPLSAMAQPHTIAQLGTAPLIGTIASTSQLQADSGTATLSSSRLPD